MQQIDIIVKQIVMLGLLGLLGFAAGKKRYLPESSGMVLSNVVIKLTAPFLIVTTLANYNFSSKTLTDGIWVYLCGVLFILLAYFFSWLVSSRLDMQESTRNVYRMQSMFGNVAFLAFPLLSALYGEQGLVYAVFFFLASDSIVWTLGIYLVNRHNTNRWADNLKHLLNANTLAFGVGVLCIVFNLQHYVGQSAWAKNIYDLLYNTFSPLGKTTIYLSMVFIGLILAEVKMSSLSDLMKRYPIFILAFFKLLLVPFIALIALSALGSFIDPAVKNIVVLQLAMPSGTIAAALAAKYESDYRFATESVFFTTLLGIVTLPFMAWLLNFLG